MKKQYLLATSFALAATFACQSPKQPTQTTEENNAWWKDATIYEVNPRQFSGDGKFADIEKQLPRLKSLGVDILWFMPIQVIGVENRKGGLGSYYSIQDYTVVNPEYGTLADFKRLVDKAHELGMKVILDWVANHTAWDAKWMSEDSWYSKDSLGNKYAPYDWSDVAELNYDSPEMRQEMINAMKYWVEEAHIDGFRSDMAHEVPTDFWTAATDSLKKVKPDLFFLAETENPDLTKVGGFYANYAWEMHHTLNALAKGKIEADSLWRIIDKKAKTFDKREIQLNFTSNHDENSWSGTEFDRMGEAAKTFAALTYVLPGMPLIYNGQEAGNKRSLLFFEKDSVDWSGLKEYTPFYQKLNQLRHDNPALWSGEAGGTIERVENSDPKAVFSFKREAKDNLVFGAFNLSDKPVEVTLNDAQLTGEFTRFENGERVTFDKEATLSLPAYGYSIYTK